MKQFIQRHIVLLGIVFIGALAGLGFVACTSDDDMLNRLDEKVTADSNPRLRTEAEAIEIAIGNLGMIDRAVPRSRAASDIVADVSVIGSKVKSRNGATNDTLLYAVNFKNNEGFALVPASRKADPLLAICEKGNYSSGCEKLNPGFGIYMGLAEKKLADLEKISDDQNSNTGNDGYEIDFNLNPIETDPNRIAQEMKETEDTTWYCRVMPRVKVQWNQDDFYGELAPNHVAGCWPIAIAQAMTYLRYPEYMQFTFSEREINDLHIDWDEINCHKHKYDCNCFIHRAFDNHKHISHIIRQIGEDAGSDYRKPNSTGTDKRYAWEFLYKYGFDITPTRTYTKGCSKEIGNNLIFIRGRNGDGDGHVWILDGVKKYKVTHKCSYRRNNNTEWEVMSEQVYNFHFNHFNWGWGGHCDGWFNDMVFDALSPVEPNNTHTDTSYFNQDTGYDDYDFVTDMEYIIVGKPK